MSKTLYIDKEIIKSSFFNGKDDKEILVIADLHYHKHAQKDILNLIIKHVRLNNPDYIVMPGDIFDTEKFLNYSDVKEYFEYFISALAEVCPVILVPGNHDIASFDIKSFFNRKRHDNEKIIKYFESLNKIKNIYFLNNEYEKIKDLTFYGFNPRLETYLIKKNQMVDELFIEDYQNTNFKLKDNEYNILVNHSPLPLFNENINNNIKDFSKYDLAITGHFHDGYMPKSLDAYFKDTDIGFFFLPLMCPYPGVKCRGVHPFGRGYVFISQGFRKWNSDIFLFNLFDKFTAHDVETLHLTDLDSNYSDDYARILKK